MISRKKKYSALFFVFFVLLVISVVNQIFRLVNQDYLYAGILLLIVLMWSIKIDYRDFDFKMRQLKVNQSALLNIDWELVYEKSFWKGSVFTLIKNGKKFGSYLIEPSPSPHRILFVNGLDEVNLFIMTAKGVFQGKYYEEIPYGGVGIVVHSAIKDEDVFFEIIKRKWMKPWYKLVLEKNY